ncbi:Src Substrate Cortactin [Manis pentadactyla]|nr:Src Substrate Cortactin [Manis pentadactyla]
MLKSKEPPTMKFLVLLCILSVLEQRTWGNVESNSNFFSEENLSDPDFNDDHFEHQPPEENLPFSPVYDDSSFLTSL